MQIFGSSVNVMAIAHGVLGNAGHLGYQDYLQGTGCPQHNSVLRQGRKDVIRHNLTFKFGFPSGHSFGHRYGLDIFIDLFLVSNPPMHFSQFSYFM